MEFETQGYSLQEGEDLLITAGITDRFIQHNRIQLVERALIDKLLEELNLGASELVTSSTTLSLGRLIAARLIITGRIIHSGPHTQVTIRMIETETGKITLAINEAFGMRETPSSIVERLSENLLQKMEKLYPLRGEILDVNGQNITINIGQKTGAKIGDKFTIIGSGANIEIVSLELDKGIAKVIQGGDALKEGMRFEILTDKSYSGTI